ncbi:MAG: sensor histidine kinase [Desulfobacterales bacterium]
MTIQETLNAVSSMIRLSRSDPALQHMIHANLESIARAMEGDEALFWTHRGEAFSCVREQSAGKAPDRYQPVEPASDLIPVLNRLLPFFLPVDEIAALPFTAPKKAVRRNGPVWFVNDDGRDSPEDWVPEGRSLLTAMRHEGYGAAVIFPMHPEAGGWGFLLILSRQAGHFSEGDIDAFKVLSESFGFAYTIWQQQAALRERLKELTCLYRITHIAEDPHKRLELFFEEAAALIASAWLYPEEARCRIVYNGQSYSEPDFPENRPVLSAEIRVNGNVRGAVEVAYVEDKPDLDEGPFLKEERRLLDTISRELTWIIERRLYEEEKEEMLKQLHHSNRLNIVGQLSASVAHEINEPLTSILGFAQLALKSQDLQKQARSDLEQIVSTALHARDIVRRLLLFSRNMPLQKMDLQLNEVVGEGLGLFRNLCAREAIDLRFEPSLHLPALNADPGQIRQVISNLLLNAIQAMPDGGDLTVQTRAVGEGIELTVGDTGCGMTPAVKDKIFIPFFTTKPAGHGTGLGLAVVDEIVRSHGGTIRVDSQPGKGTLFQVYLPGEGPGIPPERRSDGI